MLKVLEGFVFEMSRKIDLSKDMIVLGVDTDLTASIKQAVKDPMTSLLKVRADIDKNITSYISSYFKKIFDLKKSIVLKAFRTDTNQNELHFSIILKEDTHENRSEIFDILREYKNTQLGEVFPIYFQIVPYELEHKIPVKEMLLENT